MTVNKTITTDLGVGFLISTAATPPENPASKQGYISRIFSSRTPKRSLLLFMHDTTVYTGTDVENTFESTDFLQADTNYYLHIFNDSLSTEPPSFKTMSYETLNAAGNSIAALDGLVNGTIERKAGEPMIFPAVIFGGGYSSSTITQKNADTMLCVYSTSKCYPNFSGLKDYQHYRNDVNYYTMLVSPNARTDSEKWTLQAAGPVYTLQINTIVD
ncbi:hypothetical protein P0082_09715 [Candidatus Haliotispira prima]|uniref:Uncharacterized protein n=1 Tax=Candidatus Haliotispira prima TaxID=3034016 RepID=A0ABY8MFK7_9SPIO|nr:hypothetical protein P0082_09715 [Candidatus Haliotispira prima]